MHGNSHSALPLLGSFARGTSSHSLWLQYAIECVVAYLELRTFVRPRGGYFPQCLHVAPLVSFSWYELAFQPLEPDSEFDFFIPSMGNFIHLGSLKRLKYDLIVLIFLRQPQCWRSLNLLRYWRKRLETRQDRSRAAKSILRGPWLTPQKIRAERSSNLTSQEIPGARLAPHIHDERSSSPSVFVLLLAHFSSSLSGRSSVPAYLSLRHIWADYSWPARWAGSSIYPSTSTTWAMARRVDARRR